MRFGVAPAPVEAPHRLSVEDTVLRGGGVAPRGRGESVLEIVLELVEGSLSLLGSG